jgi:hypothetical protein
MMRRGAAAAILVAFAAAGFVVADEFVRTQDRPVRRLGVAASVDASRAGGGSSSSSNESSASADESRPPTSTAAAERDPAPAPWRESDDTSSDATGEGGAEVRASAAWRVVFAASTAARPSTEDVERSTSNFARHVERTLAAEASLGTPPWAASAFQACGAPGGKLTSAGRQFWPSASPEASAFWYARAMGVAPDVPTMARVIDRLGRFERRRAQDDRLALDRLVDAARGRGDARVAAYFAESGRVFLFDAERFADVDAAVKSARAEEDRDAARAAEICR